MADNLSIWKQLERTDPDHTKPFKRGGGFKGTAIKPIYTVKKMTEAVGPAGKGWGMGEPSFQVVPGVNDEVLVYCTVSVWWDDGTERREVFGVGGDKVVSHIKANDQYNRPERWENDDEAFKKAFTDAVGNGMKHLGMSADVHMGLFDDSKYVQQVAADLHAEEQPEPPKAKALPKAAARPLEQEMRDELDACMTLDDLQRLWTSPAFKAEFKKLPADWQEQLTEYKDERKAELTPKLGSVKPNFEGMKA